MSTYTHTSIHRMKGAKRGGRKKAYSSLLDILYTFGLDLGSWIVFGGRLGCYVCVCCMDGMYVVYIHKAAPDIQCRLKDLPLP